MFVIGVGEELTALNAIAQGRRTDPRGVRAAVAEIHADDWRSGNAVEDTLFFNLTQGGTTIRYPVALSAGP